MIPLLKIRDVSVRPDLPAPGSGAILSVDCSDGKTYCLGFLKERRGRTSRYSVTWGGAVNPKETWGGAAAREINEETFITLRDALKQGEIGKIFDANLSRELERIVCPGDLQDDQDDSVRLFEKINVQQLSEKASFVRVGQGRRGYSYATFSVQYKGQYSKKDLENIAFNMGVVGRKCRELRAQCLQESRQLKGLLSADGLSQAELDLHKKRLKELRDMIETLSPYSEAGHFVYFEKNLLKEVFSEWLRTGNMCYFSQDQEGCFMSKGQASQLHHPFFEPSMKAFCSHFDVVSIGPHKANLPKVSLGVAEEDQKSPLRLPQAQTPAAHSQVFEQTPLASPASAQVALAHGDAHIDNVSSDAAQASPI